MNARLFQLIFAIGLVASPSVRADRSAENAFLWQEANAIMASAHAPFDFQQAASTYQKLVDSGVRNGPVFANLGTALLQANRNAEALQAFLRAERYLGYDPEIARGIQTAIARIEKAPDAPLPWYRFLLFWHFRLSCPTRAALAAGAFSLFWIALTLRLVKWDRAARSLLILALAGLVLFGSSVVVTLYQEANAPRPLLLLSGGGTIR